MFDLLLFAFVIWSLLEYRLDEREWRLYLAAFVYGAGMADDWGDGRGFLPLFLAGDRLDAGLEFFQFALSAADVAVRAGGAVVLSAAAAAGGGFAQNAGSLSGRI